MFACSCCGDELKPFPPPNIRIALARAAGVVLLACLIFFVPACSRPRALANKAEVARAPTTLLILSASQLDFGRVAPGTRSERVFSLRNPGPSAITVTEIRTSCECFRIRLERDTLAPGEETSATAVVDFADDPGFVAG